jgi:LuxR family maltose regulon positive regulatory protein
LIFGRPFLEIKGLPYQAGIDRLRSFARAMERGSQAVELAQRHGWTDDPAVGFAGLISRWVLAWQGRLEEAEP